MKIVCLINGKLETFSSIGLVPDKIDNLIEFIPDFIEPPHSEHDHLIMEQSQSIFKSLLERETK